MRGGNHSRQASDVDKSPGELDAGKDITPTTIQTQSPQSAPNSANTINLSAVSTAHTSLYSHTFPVPEPLLEGGWKGHTTDSSSPYALHSPDQQALQRSVGRQTSADREGRYDHQDFEVKGGEVRIEIRRPHGEENQQEMPSSPDILLRDVYRDRGRGNSPVEGPSGRNIPGEISYSGGEEPMVSLKTMLATVPTVPTSKAAVILSRHHAYPNLRDRNDLPPNELTFASQENQTKTTDELADETAQYFEDGGFGGPSGMGTKKALPVHSAGLELSAPEDRETGSGPADQSSSLLGDSTMLLLNISSDHFIDGLSQRPETLTRNRTSSSSNVLRSPGGGRPSPGRLLTGKTNSSAERSSSIDPSDAAEIVRCLSADVGKRLSMLSSPGGSIKSNSGLGAGFTVVVTADDVGEINDMSGHLISIPDENDGGASGSDREAGSSLGKLGKRDKGKGRAMSEQGGRSPGESNEGSKDAFESTTSESTQPLDGGVDGRAKLGGENVRVHPGDERYDL